MENLLDIETGLDPLLIEDDLRVNPASEESGETRHPGKVSLLASYYIS